MSRAEYRRRRRDKEKRENATFNLTKEQIDICIDRGIKERLETIRNESTDTAMMLALTLPLQVLIDYYWYDMDEVLRREELFTFANALVDYYEKFNSGELDIQKLTDDLWRYGGIKIVSADYICKDGETDSRT